MLHENVLMKDIDVNHWRNLQALVLDSAKSRRRIVVIHDNGVVEKLAHSSGLPVKGGVERVEDPHSLAARLYQANAADVDFVVVFERRAVDEYFGRVQSTWTPDEDLDVFVHRTYALLDEYQEGIVTHPRPARETLGLQWRLGTGYAEVQATVERLVAPGTTVVFGVFDGGLLWTTLILGFDDERRIDVVTTVDPAEIAPGGGREATASEVIAYAEARCRRCSLALFTGLAGARAFLAAPHKGAVLAALGAEGELAGSRVPGPLADLLGPA